MDINSMTIGELKEVAKIAGAIGAAPCATKPVQQGVKQIVVLQRGWVVIGDFYRNGDDCRVENASVIRIWGTTKGIGELINGPTSKTVLDPCGTQEFHILTIVTRFAVNAEKWK